mgnify:CR=1 FL=1
MAETQNPIVISDLDIEAGIHHVMATYPPLTNDRHRVDVTIEDGVVHVSGYVKSAPTYKYLVNHFSSVKGVREFILEDFYNDEDIRLDVAKAVPPGLSVNVEYGAVILSGRLPDGMEIKELVRQVGLVDGVHRVRTHFTNV